MNQTTAILLGAAMIAAAIVSTEHLGGAKAQRIEVVQSASGGTISFVDKGTLSVKAVCELRSRGGTRWSVRCKDNPTHKRS